MPGQYPRDFRQRAVRMVEEALPDHATEFEAIKKVASRLGVNPEAVRRWRRQEVVNAGLRPGVSSDEHAEIKRLKRENAELRRANEILKAASSFFAAELDRPTTRGSDSLTCSRIVLPVVLVCVTLAGAERGFNTAWLSRCQDSACLRPAAARCVVDQRTGPHP